MRSINTGIAFALVAVGIGVAAMYASFPHPGDNPAEAPRGAGTAAKDVRNVASVASLVNGLERRLQSRPDDGKGWLLLAKSYRHLGRLDDAKNAYLKADALGHGDPIVAQQLFGLSPLSIDGPEAS